MENDAAEGEVGYANGNGILQCNLSLTVLSSERVL